MTIIKKMVLISHVLIMGLVCCSNDPLSSRNEKKGGSVSINLVATSGSIFSSLAKSSDARVTAPGIDTIRQSLTVTSNSITGLISDIPDGFNRKFEVFVYDSLGRVCYYGSAYSNIISGSTINIPLSIYRYTGKGNAAIDGSIIDSIPANPNQPPSVTITSPANNATFRQGDSIQINATATDSDGTIRNVKFYNDTTILSTDTTAPYSYTLRNVSVGTYRLKAVALDSAGATGTSAVITVTVTAVANKAPVVSITSPTNNATFRQGDTIQINANATDSDGTIRNVKFYNDTTLLSTDTTAPYSYTLRNLNVGTYRLKAVVTDNIGLSGTSTITTVTVTAASVQLTGTTFGTSPAWSTGSEYDKAFDKNTATFFDFSSADTGYTGLDLGTAKTINKLRYFPRANFANRMTGGKFQVSNISRTSGYVDLLTISAQPTAGAWTEATISDTTKYRYIRYKSPIGGYGNVAEIEIWGY